jgi:hypothetical protein
MGCTPRLAVQQFFLATNYVIFKWNDYKAVSTLL